MFDDNYWPIYLTFTGFPLKVVVNATDSCDT